MKSSRAASKIVSANNDRRSWAVPKLSVRSSAIVRLRRGCGCRLAGRPFAAAPWWAPAVGIGLYSWRVLEAKRRHLLAVQAYQMAEFFLRPVDGFAISPRSIAERLRQKFGHARIVLLQFVAIPNAIVHATIRTSIVAIEPGLRLSSRRHRPRGGGMGDLELGRGATVGPHDASGGCRGAGELRFLRQMPIGKVRATR